MKNYWLEKSKEKERWEYDEYDDLAYFIRQVFRADIDLPKITPPDYDSLT